MLISRVKLYNKYYDLHLKEEIRASGPKKKESGLANSAELGINRVRSVPPSYLHTKICSNFTVFVK
jgi:hypothetical protein